MSNLFAKFVASLPISFARQSGESRFEHSSSHTGAAVRYMTEIINPDGSVAHRRSFKKNLILDQGLNLVATEFWCNCFAYCAVGTGTNPTRRDSGAVTLSRAGTTITASAGFFVTGDTGRLLKFNSGEECYLTYVSATQATSSVSGTVAAVAGTVWYVNDTALQTETARTNTYSTSGGDNGSTFSVDTYTHKRTFLFPAVGAPVTYNEIGWSNTVTPGANIFGRDVIPGGDVLTTGQQYKVVVQLLLVLSPSTITAEADVGNNGFNTAGNINHQYILNNYSQIGSAGNTTNVAGNLEPATAPSVELTQDAFTLNAGISNTQNLGNQANNGTMANAAYTAGNFYRDCSYTFAVGAANGSTTGFYFGFLSNGSVAKALVHKFTAAQTKDNLHTLTVTLRRSWGRVLVN